jgi:putative transposase
MPARRQRNSPGKPIQNAQVESYDGRARDEFLNLNTFLTLDQAREAAADWLIDYNETRPHSALGNRTPGQFVPDLENSTSSHQCVA